MASLAELTVPVLTFEEVKAQYEHRVLTQVEGTDCPCCERFAKRYEYSLSENTCSFLVILSKKNDFVHVTEMPEGVVASRDWNRAAYFGLIEEAPKVKGGRRSGMWRLTELGRRFVNLEATIPEYVITLPGKGVIGFTGPQVNMTHFNGKKFNYQEHMSR